MARNTKRFSPSQLGTFEECPRAYWLGRNHGVAWPRGIFPSLPQGLDLSLKTHYDKYRALGELPPELVSQVPGKLFADQAKMDRWRNWRTGLEATVAILDAKGSKIDEVIISGAFDDLIDDGSNIFVFDAKSRGSAPKPGGTERYYSRQACCYHYMLEQNGMKPGKKAFFAYYFPSVIREAQHPEAKELGDIKLTMTCEVVDIDIDPNRVPKLAREAYACLNGPIPEPCNRGGEKCEYMEGRASVGKRLREAAKAQEEAKAKAAA